VLDGFAPGDRHAIAAAVEAEIGRLLTARGLPPPLRGEVSIGAVDAGAFDVGQPAGLGERIGRTVYRAMGARLETGSPHGGPAESGQGGDS
jgi:hypothetical protein